MEDRNKYKIYNEDKKIIQYLGTKPRVLANEFYMQIDCTSVSCFDNDGLIINFQLLQCTGLKDKNGKLIYEGDILEYSNIDNHHTIFSEKYVVEFGEQDLGHSSYQQTIGWNATPLYAFGKDSDMDSGRLSQGILDLFGTHKIKIIGNIYENNNEK